MSSIIYFKKGKGPFKNGLGHAEMYEHQKHGLLSILSDARGGDARAKSLLEAQHAAWRSMTRRKDIAPEDVQGVPILTNLSVKYANGAFIGREIYPTVPVPNVTGDFWEHPRRAMLQAPKTRGGVDSNANELQRPKKIRRHFNCEPDQQKGSLEMATALNETAPLNEMVEFREEVDEAYELKREVLYAKKTQDLSLYSTTNKRTLTPGIRWNDAGGDPIGDIRWLIRSTWRGKGSSMLIAWTSTEVWDVLSGLPSLLNLLNIQDRGLLSPAHFAEIFGLDGLLVSEARYDTANIGQPEVLSRIWGNYFGVARVSETPQLKNATFGYTFRWEAPTIPQGVFAQQWYDPKKGTFGSLHYKRSMFEDIRVVAADSAAIIKDPINPV
jgi:hypothetical protein